MGRRSDYEGVRAASGSSIEIGFYYCGEKCRERVKLQPTPVNLKKAFTHREGIIQAINDGTFDYPTTFPNSKRADKYRKPKEVTIKDYLETWLEKERPYISSSTRNGYRKIVFNQLIPEFGAIPLVQFKRRDAVEWARDKQATAKTIGNIISPLRIALDAAVEDELIDSNPLAGWKIRRKKAKTGIKNKIEPFSREERESILSVLSDQARNLIQFAFWTGLRTSEMVALNWDDIDWLRGVAVIDKGLTQCTEEPEEPKTAAANREVKLLRGALAALKDQKQHTYMKGKEIFQNPQTGERWAGDAPIRKTLWTYALKRANVRYWKPYTTRHTYASMMLMAGEDVRWVATQMGHTDWGFTARTYAKWIPDDAPEAGQKAEKEYSSAGNITGHISRTLPAMESEAKAGKPR